MKRVVIIGGGAAGFFAAIACAQSAAESGERTQVTLLEKGREFLTKVRISGGGRCNVTHSCFDPRALSTRYPRGQRALIAPFLRFQPSDTIAWFEARGVKLKTESDGRMFPTTDSSQTIIDCLMAEAENAGVHLRTHSGVEKITANPPGSPTRFSLTLTGGEVLECDCVLLATGGCRSNSASELAAALKHRLEAPVPSLFTFNIETPWLRELTGLSVEPVEASVPGTKLRERGPFLATHWGASGPVILRLSAWGARVLSGLSYRFPLHVNWLPEMTQEQVTQGLQNNRERHAASALSKHPIRPIPARLWEKLLAAAGCDPASRWSSFSKANLTQLVHQLCQTEFQVTGKSTNKAEFVTCGGVALEEVNFKTLESKLQPGLYFAGEVLDIDGITGGFNFQAAWTTGWIAGHAMAERD
jgi:predicted Rossmann fold flavoprotein